MPACCYEKDLQFSRENRAAKVSWSVFSAVLGVEMKKFAEIKAGSLSRPGASALGVALAKFNLAVRDIFDLSFSLLYCLHVLIKQLFQLPLLDSGLCASINFVK